MPMLIDVLNQIESYMQVGINAEISLIDSLTNLRIRSKFVFHDR